MVLAASSSCTTTVKRSLTPGVFHRDFKPDNLLAMSVSAKARVNCVLSDFGTSRHVESVYDKGNYTASLGTLSPYL